MRTAWDHFVVGTYYFVFFIVFCPIWFVVMPADTDDDFFKALIPGVAVWIFGLAGLIYYLA